MSYRVGIGYDIHRLVEGRRLFIGGVEIPYLKGLLGHSDGDALIHSICDALLGAAAENDIGHHFPDTDPRYQNIPSVELLKMTDELLKKNNLAVEHIDCVIIAQEPILEPFKNKIQSTIASVLGIGKGSVGIKAKTNEGLGEVGEKEAIACYAVALIKGGSK